MSERLDRVFPGKRRGEFIKLLEKLSFPRVAAGRAGLDMDAVENFIKDMEDYKRSTILNRPAAEVSAVLEGNPDKHEELEFLELIHRACNNFIASRWESTLDLANPDNNHRGTTGEHISARQAKDYVGANLSILAHVDPSRFGRLATARNKQEQHNAEHGIFSLGGADDDEIEGPTISETDSAAAQPQAPLPQGPAEMSSSPVEPDVGQQGDEEMITSSYHARNMRPPVQE